DVGRVTYACDADATRAGEVPAQENVTDGGAAGGAEPAGEAKLVGEGAAALRRLDDARALRRPRVVEASRYFVNVASFGMGGAVIERVKSSRNDWLPAGPSWLFGGRVSFAAAALRTAVTFERPTVAVRLDGGPEARLAVANLCVANARYFGGGMKIAPEAKLNDGRFDVVAVGDLSAAEILLNSYRVYLGTHLGLREVRHALARKVALRAVSDDGEARLEVDGELAGRLPAVFEVLPAALRLRVP
ncbi:MAG TPA: hypothetical protein VEQ42_01880, partial [Pyrinomonadaceae bacterium]|nr:hypothetical protein [Pyrinomonadaceae bacterium]